MMLDVDIQESIISVIVPVYKVEKYLQFCLDSIEAQTFKQYELILVDDGSPDRCGEICDLFAEKHENTIVIHQTNQGLSVARNNGVKHSKGEYITFVDSDDLIAEDYLETLYIEIVKYNADIATGRIYPFWGETVARYKKTKNVDKKTMVYDTQHALEEMLYGTKYGVQGCNKLFKRELIENVPFPVGKLHEDQGTMYKIIGQCNKLVFIDKPFYYYRQREDSIIHQRVTKDHLYGIVAVKEQLDFINKNFHAIVDAAEFRMVIVICKWIPGILFGSKEDRKIFEYLRSELNPYYNSIMHNKRVTWAMKIRTWSIHRGYRYSQVFIPFIEKLKKGKSKIFIKS